MELSRELLYELFENYYFGRALLVLYFCNQSCSDDVGAVIERVEVRGGLSAVGAILLPRFVPCSCHHHIRHYTQRQTRRAGAPSVLLLPTSRAPLQMWLVARGGGVLCSHRFVKSFSNIVGHCFSHTSAPSRRESHLSQGRHSPAASETVRRESAVLRSADRLSRPPATATDVLRSADRLSRPPTAATDVLRSADRLLHPAGADGDREGRVAHRRRGRDLGEARLGPRGERGPRFSVGVGHPAVG